MNRTENRHISNEIKMFSFKLTTSGIKFNKQLNTEIKLNELKQEINSIVFENFRIRDYEIVKSGSLLSENGPAIDTTLNISLRTYLADTINFCAFYIRPINPLTNNSDNPEQILSTIHVQEPSQPQTLRQSSLRNLFYPSRNNLINNSFECAICLEIMSNNSRRVLRCTHTFCIRCINRWMSSDNVNSRRSSCPLCRCSII